MTVSLQNTLAQNPGGCAIIDSTTFFFSLPLHYNNVDNLLSNSYFLRPEIIYSTFFIHSSRSTL